MMLFLLMLISIIPFQSCEPDEEECDSCVTFYKPNIYIYPKENMQLTVKLSFPQGGNVVTSIPTYGNGWNISVDTTGWIDDQYPYLFYESKQPYISQKNAGWTIKRADLEVFFRENMKNYGFYGREIQDFIEYWIPRLTDFEYYNIYPQTSELIDDAVVLSFSKFPDNLLRLYYVVEGRNSLYNNTLNEPIIETQFERKDYFVTEWGVILE